MIAQHPSLAGLQAEEVVALQSVVLLLSLAYNLREVVETEREAIANRAAVTLPQAQNQRLS